MPDDSTSPLNILTLVLASLASVLVRLFVSLIRQLLRLASLAHSRRSNDLTHCNTFRPRVKRRAHYVSLDRARHPMESNHRRERSPSCKGGGNRPVSRD